MWHGFKESVCLVKAYLRSSQVNRGGESGSHNTTAIISKFRSDKRSMSVRESGICIIVQPPLTNGSLALLVEELEEESGVQ